MADNTNPLVGHFRSPKLYANIPSEGKFYSSDVIDMPENLELAIFPMTAKDEIMMKNPDALLNGEAVATVISSCVPAIKQPRALVSNDVDTLLIAIQGATYGDDIEINTTCNKCQETVSGTVSVETMLSTMSILENTYSFTTSSGLLIECKPYSYETSVKAGLANFRTERSLQSIASIEDEVERLSAFTNNFMELANLNFEILVDTVSRVTLKQGEETVVVEDRAQIREFLENCESAVGKQIEKFVAQMANIGINKNMLMTCETCSTEEKPYEFESMVNFNPVNFFTAS